MWLHKDRRHPGRWGRWSASCHGTLVLSAFRTRPAPPYGRTPCAGAACGTRCTICRARAPHRTRCSQWTSKWFYLRLRDQLKTRRQLATALPAVRKRASTYCHEEQLLLRRTAGPTTTLWHNDVRQNVLLFVSIMMSGQPFSTSAANPLRISWGIRVCHPETTPSVRTVLSGAGRWPGTSPLRRPYLAGRVPHQCAGGAALLALPLLSSVFSVKSLMPPHYKLEI